MAGCSSGRRRLLIAPSDHALLSASGAHRWLNCTPSARLESDESE
ncbi:DUF2800 domain-containing protein, partial [Klebsiella pneumoniae]|nr:DUF2800 domain-containing protein [Klebsiella pneumoniae]